MIVAGIAVYRYARKNRIGFKFLLDAFAPTMMIAYAVGRIGCQVSGDGDWGSLNSAYVSSPEGKVMLSDTTQFRQALERNRKEYTGTSTDPWKMCHTKALQHPRACPTWLVAYNYPHNVLREGAYFPGCSDPAEYCRFLPIPVFPTPFYETVTCLILFGGLMGLRRRITFPGGLFAVYLVMNGVERFLVETIRVNTKYDWFPGHPSQAELISSGLVIAGVILWFYWKRLAAKKAGVSL